MYHLIIYKKVEKIYTSLDIPFQSKINTQLLNNTNLNCEMMESLKEFNTLTDHLIQNIVTKIYHQSLYNAESVMIQTDDLKENIAKFRQLRWKYWKCWTFCNKIIQFGNIVVKIVDQINDDMRIMTELRSKNYRLSLRV